MLKRILDRILLPPPRQPPSRLQDTTASTKPNVGDERSSYDFPVSSTPGVTSTVDPILDPNNMTGIGDLSADIDFMSWLDNMDLDMSNLINFNALWDSTGLVNG